MPYALIVDMPQKQLGMFLSALTFICIMNIAPRY